MLKIETLRDLKNAIEIIDELRKIGKSLHSLDTADCNYGLTPRQEKRRKHLEIKATQLGAKLGLYIYHQRDPRGATLYLLENETDKYYSEGYPII
jgi:hypothetical protein